ncbi:hypothetical protein F2Q69_00048747 [Brassica cretica]|uniref:Uncharacterized protein n=1 Tax=Brassica cretica TaxID=69181 RepID=A0A8S9Q378_BRACR|nr:hypothetical protein F2Q69_00048747 [Brassica cretica]
MRENSNMVLFPEYKKAKEQHKNHNMPRRSDLNQARNVIKEFEHPSIQGRTMYSSVIGGSNEEGTWRSTDSAANTDGPATMNRGSGYKRESKRTIGSQPAIQAASCSSNKEIQALG